MHSFKQLLWPIAINLLILIVNYAYLDSLLLWQTYNFETDTKDSLLGFAFLQFPLLSYLITTLIILLNRRLSLSNGAQLPKIAVQIINILITLMILFLGLKLVYGFSLSTILAASGIFSIVIGLAIRGLVSDLFSGIFLSIDQNIKPNHWLQFQHRGKDFYVKLITYHWRCVQLVDGDGVSIFIPNSEFSTLLIQNLSFPQCDVWFSTSIQLDANCNHMKALTILRNAAAKTALEGKVLAKPAPGVIFERMNKGILHYNLWFCLAPGKPKIMGMHFMMENALNFLRVGGIKVVSVNYWDDTFKTPPELENTIKQDTSNASLIENLSTVPFFTNLKMVDIKALVDRAIVRRFSPTSVIFEAGEMGSSMFIVLEGSLEVVALVNNQAEVISTLWPADYFGEMSLFTGAPRSTKIISRDTSVLLEINKVDLEDILKNNNHLVADISAIINKRLLANQDKFNALANVKAAPLDNQESMVNKIMKFFNLRST